MNRAAPTSSGLAEATAAESGSSSPATADASQADTAAAQPAPASDPAIGTAAARESNATGSLQHSFGVYVGNDPASLDAYEAWFGHETGHVMHYLNHSSWSAFDDSIDWATNLWANTDRPVLWSVPLITDGSSLDAAARGEYRDHWQKAAEALVKTRPGDAAIYVRTGWEFNSDWFPWSAKGHEDAFKEAFRDFVDVFRSVPGGERFKFEWTPNRGHHDGYDPAKAYPGDDVVDVIGMDFYWDKTWDPADPVAAWQDNVTREHGLEWHKDFSAAHGKPMAYSEWGAEGDNAGPFFEQADHWFQSNNVLYTTYWESDAANYHSLLHDGRSPHAGDTFRSVFADNTHPDWFLG